MNQHHAKYLATSPAEVAPYQVSDVSNLIPCRLFGPSVIVPTVLYLTLHQLLPKKHKYDSLKLRLFIPEPAWQEALSLTAGGLPDLITVEPEPMPTKKPRSKCARIVICLNTGRYFLSGQLAATHYHIPYSTLRTHLRGVNGQAGGRRMRYATPDEVTAIDQDPEWRFNGDLLPVLTGKLNQSA